MSVGYIIFIFFSLLAACVILQHDNTDTAHLGGVELVVVVHPSRQQCCPPVEEVVVELAIAGLELLLFQEQRVVEKREGVEDVEVVFLGQYQGIVNESFETCF